MWKQHWAGSRLRRSDRPLRPVRCPMARRADATLHSPVQWYWRQWGGQFSGGPATAWARRRTLPLRFLAGGSASLRYLRIGG